MTLAELQSYHPANNLVLLKPAVKTDMISHGTLELHAPISLKDGKAYDQTKTQPIVCQVISVPRKLIFGKRKVYRETVEELDVPPEVKRYLIQARKQAMYSETTLIEVPIPGSMLWKTKCELKPNDIVWVNSSVLMNSEGKGMKLNCENQDYYLVKYDDIYLKKSGDDVKMLNGWVLAELFVESEDWMKRLEKIGMIVPDLIKNKQFNDRIGIIRYIGDPVEYLFEDMYDHPEIQKDDIIMFKWRCNRRLEPGNKFFNKDADMIVTRRSNILSVME